jgi:glucosamine--fructose-6-phosphate aminotransferase (isomerizing)
VTIVACGTSYYAGLVAKYWFEQFARLPVDIDVASEFRYRDPVLEPGGLAIFISQSGETADTLAALRHCKANGQTIAVVVNVPTSSMAREADLLLPTHAGPRSAWRPPRRSPASWLCWRRWPRIWRSSAGA